MVFVEIGAIVLGIFAVGGSSAACCQCRQIDDQYVSGTEDDFFSWGSILQSRIVDQDPIEERHNPLHDPEHPIPGVPEKVPSDVIAELLRVVPDEPPEVRRIRRRRLVKRASRSLSHLAKAEFGSLKPSVVSEGCVRAFLLREAKARHFPYHHLAEIVTWGLHFYWLPTTSEMEVAKEQATFAYTNEAGFLARTKYYKRSPVLPAWFPWNKGKAFRLAPKETQCRLVLVHGTTTAIRRGEVPGGVEQPVPGRQRLHRVFGQVSGLGPNIRYGVHNNNLANLRRGLVERVFNVEQHGVLAPVAVPRPGIFHHRLGKLSRRLLRYIPFSPVCPLEDFPALYLGRKRTIYQKAVDSLTERPLSRKDGYLSTFLKAEKINFSKKPDPAPRVIQPRPPRYNAVVGVYLKPLEHPVYRALGKMHGSTVVQKGLTIDQTGRLIARKWHNFNHPVAVGVDASRFDQHVSKQALEWEHSIYNKLFESEELARCLKWQVQNVGFARCKDGCIKYFKEGSRMSGDMNTALGNCMLMCMLVMAYMNSKNVPYDYINNGDDVVLFMESANLRALDDLPVWFGEMGFTMVVEDPVYTLEEIEFCQMHPIQLSDRDFTMVRSYPSSLAKDLVCLEPTAFRPWLKSIGQGGQSVTSGVPIYQAFYQCLERMGGDGKTGYVGYLADSGFFRMIELGGRQRSEITSTARISFWRAFGVSPQHQLALEERFQDLTLGSEITEDPQGKFIESLPY